jgi:hypothetical protein
MQERNYLLEALAGSRTRQSWNERLEHWEKPASDSEEAMIERAAGMVRQVMSGNRWFTDEATQIAPQGSYYNNTNVRQESDIDLRAVHPLIFIQYAPNVHVQSARTILGYYDTGKTYGNVSSQLRREMVVALGARFGQRNIDASGKKAIRVHGLPGSRAAADIVPCFTLHHVTWNAPSNQYWTVKGIAILSEDGAWTLNYPEQHHDNGIAKRGRTRLRYKKVVRMLKRLRDELVDARILQSEEAPSYLVECLVYSVDDSFFLVEWDDRYDRLLRVVERMQAQVYDDAWCNAATEINGIKSLFGPHQAWSVADARKFADSAWLRLKA